MEVGIFFRNGTRANFPRNSIINCNNNNNDNEWPLRVRHFATHVNHKNVDQILGHEFTMHECEAPGTGRPTKCDSRISDGHACPMEMIEMENES